MNRIQVLSAGAHTTVQDWPGRVGYWEVGVPPSGPMDERSHRLANRLVGNDAAAAALEATLTGPTLRFESAVTVAVTGAPLPLSLDGEAAARWQRLEVPAGGVLALGTIRGVGMRAYIAFAGGIAGRPQMGSRAVFASAGLGGRTLRRGDALELSDDRPPLAPGGVQLAPVFANEVTLRVVLGPHGAPEFLTSEGLEELLDASWAVDQNSNRTGIRLRGPRPAWARADGGEAGLHPSNILDSAYSPGTIMLAGDMAVIVGPDGPSLGGFAAIASVIQADLWRLGQLRAGDRVTLQAIGVHRAAALRAALDGDIDGRSQPSPPPRAARSRIEFDRRYDGAHGPLMYRRAGERAVLVELGEPTLELRSRVRVHALKQALERERLAGVLDATPGVRSLHVQHDPRRLTAEALAEQLAALEASLPPPEQLVIAGRTVHLPLSWRHSEAMRAVARYETSVRADAPWCPDNIDFIRRINGLEDERAVRETVTGAAYLVLGLGDVYLGAPVAVPLDPRHRLVTTKYNPPRTWTPANAVGIGGAFLCVYGIEGPGGYQLVGRTVPVWHDGEDPPWRLRHFDQLRFELVEEERLEELRSASDAGAWAPRTEPNEFSLLEHERFLQANAGEIEAFKQRREHAFALERRAWSIREDAASAVEVGV